MGKIILVVVATAVPAFVAGVWTQTSLAERHRPEIRASSASTISPLEMHGKMKPSDLSVQYMHRPFPLQSMLKKRPKPLKISERQEPGIPKELDGTGLCPQKKEWPNCYLAALLINQDSRWASDFLHGALILAEALRNRVTAVASKRQKSGWSHFYHLMGATIGPNSPVIPGS